MEGDVDRDKENARPTQDVHNELSLEDRNRFNKLITKSKEVTAAGDVQHALELNKQALQICYSEKLQKRIKKMEEFLRENAEDSDEDDGDTMVHVGDDFYLYRDLYANLYAHQREGVLWMWRIFKKRKGGILGDDMGLGKTIQVIAFLSGMFDAEKVHSVLIILPVAVMINWEREFEKWAPGIRIENFHGGSKRDRERTLAKIHRRGGVLMTSYGMLVNNADQLAEKDGREYVWDSIILDEGHKIKNPANKSAKGLQKIAARQRLILTGTPVQNNLKEMWALFNWTHQGSLLGTAKTFSMEFDGPISRARQKDATPGEERYGQEMSNSLKKIIAPYFLRRTKAQVTKEKEAHGKKMEDDEGNKLIEAKDPSQAHLIAPNMPTLKRKNDLIIWAYMSEDQQRIYRDFASSDEVQALLNTSKSPLTALVVLKKICDHPRLLSTRQCHEMKLNMCEEFDEYSEANDLAAASRLDHIPNEQLVKESGKMVFLIELVDNLKSEGHRCLIFSQSRKVLDILQKVLTARGHRVARIDGTMRQLSEREDMIKRFTQNSSYSVFLLTTQVGGVGLTITAADRVIIYDPSWNPATDAQAVDRAFRIGQEKNVVVYRIITCGSIEEKIYRRQIFKDSITKQTTGENKNPYKYFSRQELFELFTLDNPRESTTQQQLANIHAGRRNTDTGLDSHIAFLHTTDIYGISDHDLMFTNEAEQIDDDAPGTEYIEDKVKRAEQLLSLENQENIQLAEQNNGRYPTNEGSTKQPRPGGSGSGGWSWPPSGGSEYIDSKALVDITNVQENAEDSDVGESEYESDASSDLEDLQKLNINEGSTLKVKTEPYNETPAGARADKPILLSDTPVRGSPEVKGNRMLVNETLTPSKCQQNEGAKNESISIISDESMVVEDSDSDSSETFHTPDKDRSEGSGKRTSPTTPDPKISAKKRRRSVAWTPGRGAKLGRPISPNASMDEMPDMDNVVNEEIVFSPTETEPVVQMEVKNPRTMSVSSADLPESEEAFGQSIINRDSICNSTRISEMDYQQNRRPAPLGTVNESIEVTTSESGDSSVHSPEEAVTRARTTPNTKTLVERQTPRGTPRTLLNDSANDSPITTIKKPKRRTRVIESDEEEEENSPDVAYSPSGSESRSPRSSMQARTPKDRRHSDSDGEHETTGNISKTSETPETTTVADVTTATHDPTRGDNETTEMYETETDADETTETHVTETDADETAGTHETETDADDTAETETEAAETKTGADETAETESGAEETAEMDVDNDEQEQTEEEEEEEQSEDEEEDDDNDDDEEDEEELTPEQQQEYMRLMMESRKLYKARDFQNALAFCVDALDIYAGDERANQYALKLQNLLENE